MTAVNLVNWNMNINEFVLAVSYLKERKYPVHCLIVNLRPCRLLYPSRLSPVPVLLLLIATTLRVHVVAVVLASRIPHELIVIIIYNTKKLGSIMPPPVKSTYPCCRPKHSEDDIEECSLPSASCQSLSADLVCLGRYSVRLACTRSCLLVPSCTVS